MAKTYIGSSHADVKKAYEEQLFRQLRAETYFTRFAGSGVESMVQEKTQLEKARGDTIQFSLMRNIDDTPGITGSSGKDLTGNEEKLTTTSYSMTLEEYANAVMTDGPLSRKRPFWDMESEHRTAIQGWGRKKLDKLHFEALYAGGFTKEFFGGSGTALGNLTTNDTLTVAKLSKIKPWLMTGGNRSQNPIRPVTVDGRQYFVCLTHPDSLYDLKQEAAFQQAMREAEVRGGQNPLFTGSTAVWDGFIIHEHEGVTIGKNAGATADVPYAKAIILGAQSLLLAFGMRPKIVTEERDFGRYHAYAFDMICRVAKPKFDVNNSGTATDYGCVGLTVARTSISDA
jgi:N4-gp56 family major capsid protein